MLSPHKFAKSSNSYIQINEHAKIEKAKKITADASNDPREFTRNNAWKSHNKLPYQKFSWNMSLNCLPCPIQKWKIKTIEKYSEDSSLISNDVWIWRVLLNIRNCVGIVITILFIKFNVRCAKHENIMGHSGNWRNSTTTLIYSNQLYNF